MKWLAALLLLALASPAIAQPCPAPPSGQSAAGTLGISGSPPTTICVYQNAASSVPPPPPPANSGSTPITGNPAYHLVIDYEGGPLDPNVWNLPTGIGDLSYNCTGASGSCNGDSAEYWDQYALTTNANYAELGLYAQPGFDCNNPPASGRNCYATSAMSGYQKPAGTFRVPFYVEMRGRFYQSGNSSGVAQLFWTSNSFAGLEEDIFEGVGGHPTSFNTNAWSNDHASFNQCPGAGACSGANMGPLTLSDACHVIGAWVQPTSVDWYLDGVRVRHYDYPAGQGPPNGTPDIVLLQNTVGLMSNYGLTDAIGAGTVQPNRLVVKYVHVYDTADAAIAPASGYGGPGDANPAYSCGLF